MNLIALITLISISTSGEVIISLVGFFILLIFVWGSVKKDEFIHEEDYNFNDNNQNSNIDNIDECKVISINFENKTDEEVVLDLFKLDKNDERYSFDTTEVGDYENLMEYLQSNFIYVKTTRVNYDSSNNKRQFGLNDWYKNYIYNVEHFESQITRNPVVVAFDDYDKMQFQKDIIQSKYNYNLGNLSNVSDSNIKKSTLELRLIPNSKTSISLFYSYEPSEKINKNNLICALSIKNMSSEKQTVELFNNEYLKSVNENKLVEIKSIFGDGHYENIIHNFNKVPLIAKDIKVIIGKDNRESICIINNKKFHIMNYMTVSQFQSDVIDVPLDNETLIMNMSIELEPKTEILISLK